MITIDVEPAKQWFSRRKQWKWSVSSDNNEPIDPRDTYANAADIRDIWQRIVASDEPVQVVVHYEGGPFTTMLRGGV